MTYQRISPAGIFVDADSSTYQRLPVGGVSVGEIATSESLSSFSSPPFVGRRRTQPTILSRVDWANPITRGLKAIFNAAQPRELVTGAAMPVVTNSWLTSRSGGRAVEATTYYTGAETTTSPIGVTATNGRTLVAFANIPDSADAARLAALYYTTNCVTRVQATTTGFSSDISNTLFGLGNHTNEVAVKPIGDVLVTASFLTIDPANVGYGRIYTHVGETVDAGSSLPGGASSPIYMGTNPVDFIALEQPYDPIALYFAAYFNRALTPVEHLSLNANPWQLFKQEHSRRYFYPRTIPSGPITPTRPVGIITSKNRYGPPKRVPDINWSSPFADYLRAAVCVSNGVPVEALRGKTFVRLETSLGFKPVRTAYGPTGFVTNQSFGGGYLYLTVGNLLRSTSNSVAVAVLSYRNGVDETDPSMAVSFYAGTSAQIRMRMQNGNLSASFSTTGTASARYAAVNYAVGTPILWGSYRGPSAATPDMYVNGAVSNGTIINSSANPILTNPNVIGFVSTPTAVEPMDGGTALAVLLEGLTDAAPFFKALNENPWQIFRERVPRLYSVSGLSPGSASVSEEGFFATASLGSETINATRNPLITLSGLLGTTYLGNEQINRSTTVLSGYHQATMSLGDETIDIASQAFKAFWAHYANTVIKTRL